jgi:NADH-quinone oxidoreductase subunit C
MRTENEVIQLINDNLKPLIVKKLRDQNISVTFSNDTAINGINFLKSHSYIHLSTISCVDWIDDNEFELVYHLFSYEDRINISVKTRIDRESASYLTIMNLWPVARFYERDIHDFFGVTFEGNDDMEELILENWNDIPPMRKDFDTRKYVNEKYEWRDYRGQKHTD